MILIGGARATAFFMYPGKSIYFETGNKCNSSLARPPTHTPHLLAEFALTALIMIFITKFRFTLTCIANTPFALWLFQDLHNLHVYCGWDIAINSTLHVSRWA